MTAQAAFVQNIILKRETKTRLWRTPKTLKVFAVFAVFAEIQIGLSYLS